MSIGACCLEIPTTGPLTTVHSFSANIAWPEGLQFDHEPTQQFWADNPDAFAKCTDQPKPPEAVAEALKTHIMAVQDTARKRKAKYVVVTDNAFFDVPWIDWFLSSFAAADALPLRHNYFKGWMSVENVVDVNQRLRAVRELGIKVNVPAHITNGVDHTPLTDATCIAHKYAFLTRWTKGKRAQMKK